MTPQEQEIAINELEDRVDRLRNLYEQYFLGFERLEPTVPKKDVERRFMLLRKEQIRNTAMRFRFNVITQKYNTYSIHWIRICRQIEDGTYKRHVRRAKARFGDTATPERDISIDIDMADFDMDMDEVLEEANAAASRYERAAPDTVPPPASDRTLAEQTKPSNHDAAAVVAQIRKSGPSSAAVTSARAPVSAAAQSGPVASGPVASAPSSALMSERTPRPVMMPAGVKPRIIVRKKEDADGGPGSTGTPTPGPAPSVGRTPASAPSVGRTPGAAPRGPGSTPNAPSVQRIAAPPPLADTPVAGVPIVRPSVGGPRPVLRQTGTAANPKAADPAGRPAPAPPSAGAPGAPRIPVAKPAGGLPPPSERSMPAAPVSQARPPAAPPSAPRIPPGSSPRPAPPASSPKASVPQAPGSSPRPVPPPPGSAPRPPAPSRPEIVARPPPPAPGSSPKLPPASSPRLPPPSAPRVPVAPGSQPRAPLPLPTASRPKPKDEP